MTMLQPWHCIDEWWPMSIIHQLTWSRHHHHPQDWNVFLVGAWLFCGLQALSGKHIHIIKIICKKRTTIMWPNPEKYLRLRVDLIGTRIRTLAAHLRIHGKWHAPDRCENMACVRPTSLLILTLPFPLLIIVDLKNGRTQQDFQDYSCGGVWYVASYWAIWFSPFFCSGDDLDLFDHRDSRWISL